MSARRTVLITGAAGQVGVEAVRLFGAAGWEVVGHAHGSLDITDRSAVLAAVESARPEAIVNLAAWNAVDLAETEVDGAYAVNAIAVRHLAEAGRRVGARLCHVSTDYVFDGTKDGPYVEWDRTNPQSAYGRSKEAGEQEVPDDGAVVRTSWVCGYGGTGNIVKTVLRLADTTDTQLSFVTDQIGCPTFAADLAATLLTLVEEGHAGTFHATNARAVSWYEFVQEILVAAGHPADRVGPILTAELDPPRPAPRPANSVLDGMALRLSGVAPLRDHGEALEELVAALRADQQPPATA